MECNLPLKKVRLLVTVPPPSGLTEGNPIPSEETATFEIG
jgi:hypothetical protein